VVAEAEVGLGLAAAPVGRAAALQARAEQEVGLEASERGPALEAPDLEAWAEVVEVVAKAISVAEG
jgi:hypothetical protein